MKLELRSPAPAKKLVARIDFPTERVGGDYVEIGRAGGLPIEVAVTAGTVSVRTAAAKVRLGVATETAAVVVEGTAAKLPEGSPAKLRVAVAVEQEGVRERRGFADNRPIHRAVRRRSRRLGRV
ncbi:MAG: hypothetical protein QM775_11120 [Pirellulales bacterium]